MGCITAGGKQQASNPTNTKKTQETTKNVKNMNIFN